MIVRLILIAILLPTLAFAQTGDAGEGITSDNPLSESDEARVFSSPEGDFRITFPSGCSRIVTRVPSEELPDVDGIHAVVVSISFCDRFGEKGDGCSVTSLFNVTNAEGGYPGPEQVIERLVSVLKGMNVTIQKESPIRKELPDGTAIEGIDLFAADSSGVGQAWLRGVIYEGDIYIMSAWKSAGGLWNNQEFITFFNSFQPGAE